MSRYWTAHLSVLVTILAWGMAPVAIRYLSGDYTPYTQAFFRYLCAMAALLVYSLFFCRQATLQALRVWRPLLVVAIFNVAGMVAWTHGCYLETATLAQLITKLYMPIVVVVSFIVFHEERRVIRSPRFLFGSFLGLLGVVFVLIDDPAAGGYMPRLSKGTLILALTPFLWAGYNVLAKHVVEHQHPIGLFTVVSVFTTFFLAVLAVAFEWPLSLRASTPELTALAALSGVVPIAVGHCAFHYGQKHLGAAYCGSLLLLTPFVSNALAIFFWEDEVMIWIQWIGTAILLWGNFLVIQAGRNIKAPQPD